MKHYLLALTALATLAAAPAAAQVTLENKVMREDVRTAPNGTRTTTLVPAKNIAPGLVAVYVMTFRNSGTKPATGLVISNPIPGDLVYVGPAADNPVPTVSVDGGRSFGPIERATVRSGAATRQAQFADVTNVKWEVATLAPGTSGSVSYRARVR